MSDLKLPGEDEKPKVSFARAAVWFILGAIGLYMVLSGLGGVLGW
jgi:hypothetical protein